MTTFYLTSFAQTSKPIDVSHQSLQLQLFRPTFCASNECLPPKRDRALSLCLLACFKVHNQLSKRATHPLIPPAGQRDFEFYRTLVVEELKSMSVTDPELGVKEKGQVGSEVVDDVVSRFFAAAATSTVKKAVDGEDVHPTPVRQCPATVSVVGALMAQEAIKAVTHVHTPLSQLLVHESLQCVTEAQTKQLRETTAVRQAKLGTTKAVKSLPYDPEVVEELRRMRVFVVGAGAIGCELLKNFALMGVGSGARYSDSSKGVASPKMKGKTHNTKRGSGASGEQLARRRQEGLWPTHDNKHGGIVVTDMDVIERSNLNRQLLFRFGQYCAHLICSVLL